MVNLLVVLVLVKVARVIVLLLVAEEKLPSLIIVLPLTRVYLKLASLRPVSIVFIFKLL